MNFHTFLSSNFFIELSFHRGIKNTLKNQIQKPILDLLRKFVIILQSEIIW